MVRWHHDSAFKGGKWMASKANKRITKYTCNNNFICDFASIHCFFSSYIYYPFYNSRGFRVYWVHVGTYKEMEDLHCIVGFTIIKVNLVLVVYLHFYLFACTNLCWNLDKVAKTFLHFGVPHRVCFPC